MGLKELSDTFCKSCFADKWRIPPSRREQCLAKLEECVFQNDPDPALDLITGNFKNRSSAPFFVTLWGRPSLLGWRPLLCIEACNIAMGRPVLFSSLDTCSDNPGPIGQQIMPWLLVEAMRLGYHKTTHAGTICQFLNTCVSKV